MIDIQNMSPLVWPHLGGKTRGKLIRTFKSRGVFEGGAIILVMIVKAIKELLFLILNCTFWGSPNAKMGTYMYRTPFPPC